MGIFGAIRSSKTIILEVTPFRGYTMSKKHFVKIAQAISEIEDIEQREKMAVAMADVLRGCNPRFNRSIFLSACGVNDA